MGRELGLCGQMMHDGWEVERARWEEVTRAAQSVQDIGNAVAYLEDWIALDYAPGSDVCNCLVRPKPFCDAMLDKRAAFICVCPCCLLGLYFRAILKLVRLLGWLGTLQWRVPTLFLCQDCTAT